MQRPTGVTILAALYFWVAGILGIASVLLILGRSFFSGLGSSESTPQASARELMLFGFFCLAVALLDLVCGIGLIRLKKWARVMAIAVHVLWAILWALSLVGLRLHPSLFSLVFRLVTLAVQIWILMYLSRGNVKRAFETAAPKSP